ncbi:MAG: hypothetical protein ACK4V2_00775 [Pseudomonadota bacterium]|jgi:hypothetical protein|nr:hypothetical protein [Alphaproteobacteria bacterium]
MRFFLIMLTIITSLYYEAEGAMTPSQNDIAAIEGLIDYRASKGNVWRDNLTNQSLYRYNAAGAPVQAGLDADITLSPLNATTITMGYLNNPDSPPQATSRSSELTCLIEDPHWKVLYMLTKNYRISLGRTQKDCLGKDLYELVGSSEYKPAADMRDITNISSLIDAIAPCITAATATGPVAGIPEFSDALMTNFDRLLTFRGNLNKIRVDSRGNRLYRIDKSNTLVVAAYDLDVKEDLSNLVDLMCDAVTQGMPISSASSTPASDMLSDSNLKRLYEMVETYRKSYNFFSRDAAGRALYLEDRTQSVDMRGIIDKKSLLMTIFQFFHESLRPAL